MEEQIGTLESVPTRCPLIPENELLGTAYRHFLYGNYRTIFKVAGSRAIIMRVLHEARVGLDDAGGAGEMRVQRDPL